MTPLAGLWAAVVSCTLAFGRRKNIQIESRELGSAYPSISS